MALKIRARKIVALLTTYATAALLGGFVGRRFDWRLIKKSSQRAGKLRICDCTLPDNKSAPSIVVQ
jgi:hypothetical protein